MALGINELQTMLDELDAAIYSGAKRIQAPDRSVELNSVADLQRARAALVAQITALSTTTTQTSFSLVTHSRE